MTISNPAKILLAYMRCSGVSDAKQLSTDLDIPLRTIQRLKLECATSANDASCAIYGAPEAPNTPYMAHDQAPIAPDMAPLACATKELPSVVSSYSDKQTNTREDVCSSGTSAALKAEFNGSTENLIVDVLAWMGPSADRGNAVKWLTSMLSLHGRDTVLASYQQIVASQAKGDLIANPISYFSKVAAGIKAKGPAVAKQADVLPFKVTTAMNVKPRLDPPMVVANA